MVHLVRESEDVPCHKSVPFPGHCSFLECFSTEREQLLAKDNTFVVLNAQQVLGICLSPRTNQLVLSISEV